MSHSVKTNYFFNLLNTGTQLLFPLITFPYASRIMQADGIGQVNFFSSIVSYISLFTCLGIPMYALREIARVRDNVVEMNKTAVEVLILHALLTLGGYIVVAIICITVTKVQSNIPLFLILSSTIFFTAIGCEWFYQGMEDFKYITIRGLIVKLISIVLLFLLVKTKDDLLWYGAYTVFGVLGGNIFNFFRLRKYIHKQNVRIRELHPFRHLKPALHVFVFNVITSIYLQLNTIFLGFMKNPTAVGYFTAGTKIVYVALGVSSAFGSVMLPHLANLIAENKLEEFKAMAQKAFSFIFAITLPLSVGLIFCSPYAIRILCGSRFDPSILVSQIASPIIFFIGLSNVLGMQILYPMGRINTVIKCTLIGAIVNVVLNIGLIPFISQYGTAVATFGAEFAVTFSMFILGKKFIPIKYMSKDYLNYILGVLAMGIALYFINKIHTSNIMMLVYMIIGGCITYFAYLSWRKDPFCIQVIKVIRNRFH
jgi:O-antigen/teichoic acid export membrane protein